jgi:ornithine cyclodeaminase
MPENRFSVKSASTAALAGLKVGSYWPDNLEAGRPRHNSFILLFDQSAGRITVAMEAGLVNAYRTAAADAVAANHLARKDATVLTIFSAGNQAYFECLALARVRPIREILIVARNLARADDLARRLRKENHDRRNGIKCQLGFSGMKSLISVASVSPHHVATVRAALCDRSE